MSDFVTQAVAEQICFGYNPALKVVSWKSGAGSKLGDGTTSTMIAATLVLSEIDQEETSKQELEVMLKTISQNPALREMAKESNSFQNESTIYHDIGPLFEEVQKQAGIPDKEVVTPFPICYAVHEDGETDYMAMENLKKLGYRHGNRVTGLDFNHCSLVLRNIAKFHAISVAKFGGSRYKILEAFPIFNQKIFDKQRKLYVVQQQYFSQSFKTQAESLKKMGENLASSRLEKLAEADLATVLGNLVTDNIECAVVTHGDLWVNNIMFQYGKNNLPIDVKFIDFQLTQATSRLVDVFYFLLNSARWDILREREDDLLRIYYSEFTGFAENLGVNTRKMGLTWENFLKEAETFRLYSVFFGIIVAPITSADTEDLTDTEGFTESDFDNSTGALGNMIKGMTKDLALEKTKMLVLEHLPKCNNAAQFL